MSSRRNFRRGGVPPRIDPAFADALNQSRSSPQGRNAKADQKASQLRRQVHRALHLAFGGIGDPALADVSVIDVVAGNGNALLVHVSIPAEVSLPDVLTALERATPRLRAAVAESITRKRTPELLFLPTAAEVRS